MGMGWRRCICTWSLLRKSSVTVPEEYANLAIDGNKRSVGDVLALYKEI